MESLPLSSCFLCVAFGGQLLPWHRRYGVIALGSPSLTEPQGAEPASCRVTAPHLRVSRPANFSTFHVPDSLHSASSTYRRVGGSVSDAIRHEGPGAPANDPSLSCIRGSGYYEIAVRLRHFSALQTSCARSLPPICIAPSIPHCGLTKDNHAAYTLYGH
ncbi:uncharacterized protein B0T15DRAFT_201268 [Chaetomium strumarium]|uniref:Uncharacterized protein n=1 Tax=Chaetomium strumarium TaxID=1170767 RepID=A0AAJ0GSX4_9PEZI|nr:hypothetical protein B0T15DRAFT_201268 [Chaetomium strumarium]